MNATDLDQDFRRQLLLDVSDDHRRFEMAAEEADAMGEPDPEGELDGIVTRACEELLIHAQMEEEILYPALRAAIPQKRLIDEAVIEHASIQALVEALRTLAPEDEQYLPAFAVLRKFVQVHVENEENELFALIEDVQLDWKGLQHQWTQRRQVLLSEHGLEAPEDEVETTA